MTDRAAGPDELAAYKAAVERALELIETSPEAFLPTTSNNIRAAAGVMHDVHDGCQPATTMRRRTEYGLLDADETPGVYLTEARDHREAALIAADYPCSRIVQRTVTTTTTPWATAGEDQ